jgi:hypothetical protein
MALTQVQGQMLTGSTNTTTTIQSNGTTAITIDSSQRVGIGTTSPAVKLDVFTDSTNDAEMRVTRTSGSSVGLYSTTNASWVYTVNNNPLIIGTNNAERMRINSDGALRVGTTAIVYSASELVSMRSTSSNYTLGLESSTGVCLAMNMSGQSSGTLVRFDSSGSLRGSISTNGSTVAYNTSSDYRLKENIAPMTGALAKVSALKPCTYTWKADGSNGEGFIAHELAEVVPDAVTGEKDAVEIYTDENGDEQTRIKPQGIDTSFLVATLTAAIQEQQAIITDLKARIETLEAK